MKLYLDASALVPLVVQEARTDAMVRLVSNVSNECIASDFALAETYSAISRLERTRQRGAD